MQDKNLSLRDGQTIQKNPRDVVFKLLEGLEERARDIIIRRFGLEGKPKETLESIGKSYGITRERVRQIESSTLNYLKKPNKLKIIRPLEEILISVLRKQGDIAERNILFNSVRASFSQDIHPNVLEFVLEVSPKFTKFIEDEEFRQAWAISKNSFVKAKKIIKNFIDYLKEKGKPLPTKIVLEVARNSIDTEVSQDAILSYISLSKNIKKNPFGEWGLATWNSISPQGVKDKAYLVLSKKKKPLHFREIAEMINQIGFDSRQATSRTVHNALIKDPRFVLVGRGTYGLAEAGYKPGTVADIITSILTNGPLTKEEIVHEVLKQRLVKKNTVILALQDSSKFKKIGDRYYLIQK